MPADENPGRRFDPGIEFGPDGGPRSRRFDDIYYQPGNGAEESQAVFLGGCGLPDGWRATRRFTVGETGFGTGLNFLLTWDAWRRSAGPGQRLHYVSVEGYPLSPDELRRALAPWPALAPLARRLQARYGHLSRGFERLHFEPDRVTLTLLVGDAASVLEQLEATVDAWYLDGFAPARNPQMWSAAVLEQVARLSATGARLATYTAAGEVRRGLAALGFEVRKAPGFGPKRERLEATYRGRPRSRCPVWAAPPPVLRSDRAVTVIGGGVAGRSVAAALTRRGHPIALFDVGGGASRNPAAIVMPRLEAGGGRPGRLFWAAYRYALRHWQELLPAEPEGALLLARGDAEQDRQRRIVAHWGMEPGDARRVGAAEAASLAGIALGAGGLWFPGARCVDGGAVCGGPPAGVELHRAEVARLAFADGAWQPLAGGTAPLAPAAPTVLATGAERALVPWRAPSPGLPLERWQGQATAVAAGAASAALRVNLVCGRYLTAAHTADDGATRHWLGAGFERVGATGRSSAAADRANLAALARALPELPRWRPRDVIDHWHGVRSASPDRLPLAGPLVDPADFVDRFSWLRHSRRPPRTSADPPEPTGLFGLLAFGARGFTSAPLLAEWLASLMCGDPWPLERDLMLAVHANRFLVRGLKRGEI